MYEGVVQRMGPQGASVTLLPGGLTGLVHATEISKQPMLEDMLSTLFKPGEKIKVSGLVQWQGLVQWLGFP